MAEKNKTDRKVAQIDPELFVKTWQNAGSAKEVAQKLGLTEGAVSFRATRLRKELEKVGYTLKNMQTGRVVGWTKPIDAKALSAFASKAKPSKS